MFQMRYKGQELWLCRQVQRRGTSPSSPRRNLLLITAPSVLIPIKKFALPEDDVAKVIPTLSDRQFVVSKSNLSKEQERAQRELFWYREELFKYVRGRWKEVC